MEIIQIVGYKNSGKTTLAEMLIKTLSQHGLRVASLKHHGHGGTPSGIENTDSEKHRRSGALIAGVEGEGVFQLSKDEIWDVAQMTEIYEQFNIDILIVEGFKNENFKKIVTLHKKEDIQLLDQLSNIQAVITTVRLDREDYPYPVFRREEAALLCNQVYENIVVK